MKSDNWALFMSNVLSRGTIAVILSKWYSYSRPRNCWPRINAVLNGRNIMIWWLIYFVGCVAKPYSDCARCFRDVKSSKGIFWRRSIDLASHFRHKRRLCEINAHFKWKWLAAARHDDLAIMASCISMWYAWSESNESGTKIAIIISAKHDESDW